MKTIKILFAEDHEMVRKSIILSLLNQKIFIAKIDEAVNGIEAIEKATKNYYDIIILDINLPLKDGLSVTKLLKSKNDNVRILALTLHGEYFIIKQMIEAGVLGYVLKNSGIGELITAILKVADFEKYYCNDVAQILLNKSRKTTSKGNNNLSCQNTILNADITPRELEILSLISMEFTNKEIGERLDISERTVSNHRNNLILKLQVKNSIGLATYALRNGLI